MSVLSTLLTAQFNTLREQWENSLKTELKLNELTGRTSKKTIDGGIWPTLSLSTSHTCQLSARESWKKASQTYLNLTGPFESFIDQDIENGVRNFFFHKNFLTQEYWKRINHVLSSSEKVREVEVFLLGTGELDLGMTPFKTIDENSMVSGSKVHYEGGTIVQELALLTCNLIERVEHSDAVLYLGVFTDSQFFRNIAKLRAARLLAMKVLEESKVRKDIVLVALSSYREWTFYERYSNMLRNDTAVASALIGGADHVQSSGYNLLFEVAGGLEGEHYERSLRMARNTSHILALESMLGVVQDPAFGSYHLEGLTHHFAESAWKEMQRLLRMEQAQMEKFIAEEVAEVRERRLKEFRNRKHVLAGINDFPDPRETISLRDLPSFPFFRLAQDFEALRLKMENSKTRPEVYIGIFGDYAALNARLSFIKNYFQLLGLNVHEVSDREEFSRKEDIVVLCALDEDYPSLKDLSLKAHDKYIAGKFEMDGHVNLFAGQDVLGVLEGIVNRWSTT